MPITLKTKTIFHCKCIRPECGHEWDALTKPQRCARCKRRQWNGEDHRLADPFGGVESEVAAGAKAPQLPGYLPLLRTLVAARRIIAKVIEDDGPCNHKRDDFKCVCEPTEVLANLDQRIQQLDILHPTYLKRKKEQKRNRAKSAAVKDGGEKWTLAES